MVSRCGGHRSVDSAQWKHCYVLALSATILVKMNLNTQNTQLELMNNTREPLEPSVLRGAWGLCGVGCARVCYRLVLSTGSHMVDRWYSCKCYRQLYLGPRPLPTTTTYTYL